MPSVISTDVLIVGAGVAGLWLNARLRRQGFSTVLVESASLGGGQSVKSQGIIHGGAKYALHGALTGASEAIADMPRRWREALAGDGELDLSGVRLLSEAHYLWSPGTIAGNLTSFFASKAVRGRVDQVKGDQLPPALQDRAFKGKVYRLAELVVDVPSLLQRLAELLGPWTVSGPTRVLAQACFADHTAHLLQIDRCAASSQRLAALLRSTGLAPSGGCDLFQYVRSERAAHLHDFLARHGILVRLFALPAAVRLGLPACAADEQRLARALADYQKETA